jgi:Flp pilus assembly protein TadG
VLRRRLRESAAKAHKEEQGQIAFLMVLSIIIVFAMAGLSLDAGLWYFDHRTAQNQADAAALAGVLELPASGTQTDADARAAALAQVNLFLQKNGTDPATEGDGVCPTANDANYVDFVDETGDGESDTIIVCVRRQTSSVFSSLAGLNFVHVSAMARAELVSITVPYSLMAMDETACRSFWLTGNGTIHVEGTSQAAGTYTRSNCPDEALATTGANSDLEVEGVNDVVGGANSRCDGGGQCDPEPTKQEWLDDPFARVPLPPVDSSCISVNVGNGSTQTLDPGCYNSLQVGGTAILRPGVYILKGGLSITGNSGVLTADANQNGTLEDNEEVMFYVTCTSYPTPCNGANAGIFSSSGQSTFELQGIDGDPYENLAIFVDRTAGPATAVDISGQGASTMSGAVYAIGSNVTITGNGTTLNLNIAVVADTLKFAGNGDVNVTYDIELIPPLFRLALTE